MAIGGRVGPRGLAALVLAAGVWFGPAAAEATTIYTFNFVQSGYAPVPGVGGGFDTATVSGTFSGTLNPGGYLEAANLTDYHLNINYDINPISDSHNFGPPSLFSYLPGDDGSLTIVQAMDSGVLGGNYTCIGAAVGLACNGQAGWRGSEAGSNGNFFLAFLSTTSAPVVTLVSAVDQPPVSQTPLPATLPLLMTAFGGLGAFGAWQRKRSAA